MQHIHNEALSPIATFSELGSVLDTFRRPLTVLELLELTFRLQLTPAEWQGLLAFRSDQFCFRTVYSSLQFEINLIGWQSGQYSSVHDHRGTACCVLVLDGVLTNRDYRVVSVGELEEIRRLDLYPGEILSRSDREIHRCGNEQTGGVDLVTLHLYSPPLRPLAERQYL